MKLIDPHKTEPWYYGYAFQGAVVLGTAPILLPIIVGQAGGAAHAGLVVACFYVGELLAPLWGGLTDKTGRYEITYLGGFVMLALGLILFAFTKNLALWCLLAFVQGSGAAATNTVAGMYIVEYRPKEEWDGRIGWLQTFYGTGQTAGLALAALLQSRASLGMIVSGVLMIPALIVGRKGLPKDKEGHKPPKVSLSHHTQKPARRGLSLLHRYHRPTMKGIRHLASEWSGPFGLYILSWFFVMFGTWMLYNLYPLVMKEVYQMSPGISSLVYAAAAALGIFFYAPSGTLGHRFGDRLILLLGILMTVVSLGGLSILAYLPAEHRTLLAGVIFIIQPVAWSPLIVAGTALTAELATMEEGEAMGIFNASTALASVISALAAGTLANWLGYKTVPFVGAVTAIAGLFMFVPLMKKRKPAAGEK